MAGAPSLSAAKQRSDAALQSIAVVSQLADEPPAIRGRRQRAQLVSAAADAVLSLVAVQGLNPREEEETARLCAAVAGPLVKAFLKLCSSASGMGDTAMSASAQDSLHRACAALVQRG
eukprot:Hpha_TRINITY_DN23809_c0_g1::TRINITY_DN23809_c0_g1_i1::g.109963::m.109963